MSLREELKTAMWSIEEVERFAIDGDSSLHGDSAIEVTVVLVDGRTVVGTFTTEAKPGFGGVEFDTRKNIPQLMRSKVEAVLAGTAEEVS